MMSQSPERRRVKHPLQAWHARVVDQGEDLPRQAVPDGEPIIIEALEEVNVIPLPHANNMALISYRDELYLISIEDLTQRTMRLIRTGRRVL